MAKTVKAKTKTKIEPLQGIDASHSLAAIADGLEQLVRAVREGNKTQNRIARSLELLTHYQSGKIQVEHIIPLKKTEGKRDGGSWG